MVSVIVPVYNVKSYLLRCLQSLENQTENDIEFIIVNDGSTDGSDKICQGFIKDKDKFRYVSKKNGGLMSAWMEGLKHVRGEYVGFVDSDDYIERDMFEKLTKKAKQYDADMVMCKFLYEQITADKRISQTVQNNGIVEGYYAGETLCAMKAQMLPKSAGNYISPSRCNKIIKREVLERNLKYCDTFIASGEDVNIILPCFFATEKFYYLDEALYHYVRNGASITYKYKKTLKEQYIRLLSKIEGAISEYAVDISTTDWYHVVNSYGAMLLRTTLNSALSRGEKKKAVDALCAENLFFEAAVKTDKTTCDKWERAYVHSIIKKNTRRVSLLLILSKIKNKMRRGV